MSLGALVPLGGFLLGCSVAAPPVMDAGQVRVSLAGRWRSGQGSFDLPTQRLNPVVAVHRELQVPAEWAASPSVRFGADAFGWRVKLAVNGQAVGEDVGGLRPVNIDLTGALPAGLATLSLRVEAPTPATLWPGQSALSVLPATFAQPREGSTVALGQLWLDVAPAARLRNPEARLDGNELVVRVEAAGAESQPVAFRVVRDGLLLAELPEAVVRDGVAESRAVWRGARWQPGGSEEPSLQYLVASLPSGVAAEVRFGARSLEREGAQLQVNGVPFYLVGQRLNRDGEPREQLAAVIQGWALLGYNSVELHGEAVSDTFFAAADELGLPVVLTPFCDGRRREGGEFQPDAVWAAYMTELSERVSTQARRHPSVLLQSLEAKPEPGWPKLYEAFFAGPIPTVDLRTAQGIDGRSAQRQRAQVEVPVFYPELAYPLPTAKPESLVTTLEALLAPHAPSGMGIVLPDLLPDDLRRATPAERAYGEALQAMLLRAKTPRLATGRRRGAASLEVSVTRGGAPAEGEVVVMRAVGQVPQAAFADARGAARFELDYAGPVVLSVLGAATETPATLVSGQYTEGRWSPNTTTAQLALP